MMRHGSGVGNGKKNDDDDDDNEFFSRIFGGRSAPPLVGVGSNATDNAGADADHSGSRGGKHTSSGRKGSHKHRRRQVTSGGRRRTRKASSAKLARKTTTTTRQKQRPQSGISPYQLSGRGTATAAVLPHTLRASSASGARVPQRHLSLVTRRATGDHGAADDVLPAPSSSSSSTAGAADDPASVLLHGPSSVLLHGPSSPGSEGHRTSSQLRKLFPGLKTCLLYTSPSPRDRG